ncbi:MAG: DUF3810 domain-containing protein [Clostridiales bacterium]|nr:DUF3810 domain-containing protein [Clostridiales bacterium]
MRPDAAGRSESRRICSLYGPFLLAVLIPSFLLLLLRLLCADRPLVNWVIVNVTTPIKHGIAWLCSHLPFSLAEVVWTVAVVGIIGFILRTLWMVGKSLVCRLRGQRAHPLRRLLRRGLALLSAGLLIYSGYTVMWGINYYGDTFSEMSGLEGRGTTVSELYDLASLFASYCNDLSDGVQRDEDGVCVVDSETLFQRSNGLYEALYDQFPCLDLEESQARPMFYSRLLSWLGFTGFYFPFTGESLVNVDAPAALVPATILHELAHQRNVAQESECNFLAVVAGLSSDDPEFQYSAALMGYIHVGNALYSADRELWREVRATVNEQVLADLTYNNAYWAQFESPASDAAEAVYSSFASSYGQEDIMKSYGACVDLLAAYYLP